MKIINQRNIIQLFVLVGFLVCLVSCLTDGDDSDKDLQPFVSSGVGDDDSNGNLAIDCANLDPDKIYVIGTLQEGSIYEALFDPEYPTELCVGFSNWHKKGFISMDGKYIFAVPTDTSLYFYSMIPDTLVLHAGNQWTYPEQPHANDFLLFSSQQTCTIAVIMMNQSSGEIVYSCPSDTVHTESQTNYYDLDGEILLGVMPDGLLLVSRFSAGIKLVDSNINEIALDFPENAAIAFSLLPVSKLFIDPETGNSSVWIVGQHAGEVLRRLSVDLVSLNIADDGLFSEPLSTIDYGDLAAGLKLDGDGTLWQRGRDSNGDDVITKRPLQSTGNPTVIVYSEGDEPENSGGLFGKLYGPYLVTGL